MSQSNRRVLFWCSLAVMVVLGAWLGAKAGTVPDAASQSQTAPDKDQVMDQPDDEQGLVSSFFCAVSVMNQKLEEAEVICSDTINLMPESPVGFKFRGYAYLLEHRFEKAEADFHEAVRLDPTDADSQAGYGQSFSGQGRFPEAIDHFDAALKISPHDVRFLSARCWAKAGDGKNLASALADCNRALTLALRSAVTFDSRGLVRLRQSKNALAAKDFSTSLTIEPNRASALFGKGVAEFRQRKLPAARLDLFLARRLNPEIDALYIQVGVLPPGCIDEKDACPLPDDMRAHSAPVSPFQAVSFLAQPPMGSKHADAEDVRIMNSIALGRVDAMLNSISVLMGKPIPTFFIWQDADEEELTNHLAATRASLEGLRKEACRSGIVRLQTCARLPYLSGGTSSQEIETLMNGIEPIWLSLCAKDGNNVIRELCQME